MRTDFDSWEPLTAEKWEATRAHTAGTFLRLYAVTKSFGAAVDQLAHERLGDPFLAEYQRYGELIARGFRKAAVDSETDPDGAFAPHPLGPPLLAASRSTSVFQRLQALALSAPVGTPAIFETASAVGHLRSAPGGFKGLTKVDFAAATLSPITATGLLVVSSEVLRRVGAESLLLQRLAAAVSDGIDAAILSASHPDSLLAGVGATGGTGTFAGDVAALLSAYVAGGGKAEHATFLLSSQNIVNAALGAPGLGDLGPLGATRPVRLLANDALGSVFAIVDTSTLTLAEDEDALRVDVAKSTSLQMEDSSPAVGAATSMFQTNQVALRVERIISWRGGSPQFIAAVDYGTGSA